MSSTLFDQAAARQLASNTILSVDFRRATFGGPARGENPCFWQRVIIRPVEIRGRRCLQFSYFDAKKHIAKNFDMDEGPSRLAEVLDAGFARVHLTTSAEETDIQTTKKGKVIVGRRTISAGDQALPPHNRVKEVPLPEGRSDPLLELLGILTGTGKVRPTMRAKYTQINELLKQLTHVLDEAQLRSLGRPLEILDCGCGSSHLTFAVHHYLNDVLGIPARIIGVDVNEELIRKSIERSASLAVSPNFACSRIDAVAVKPDIVLALHACDTATDDALAHAIAAGSRIILSVPCCHHHLNDQLRPTGSAEVLRPLLRHGILQQRSADLVTDAFRALILRIMGYRTDVVEFISVEHTARNLMIRAVHGLAVGDAAFVSEYLALCHFLGVTPYLEGVLGERFQQLLANTPCASATP
jgi:SAM-dependent methyltransferase